ncbi:MAG TPA: HlyD family efflux transporter periplasmic adaptor subunit [Polyangia bacterium]|jgi:membrane fusion protein (multidrug efflux system)|nr:HlyD family efflux transporter periplasmic adaptor subunit [Polyangia bacterium]
MFDAEPTIPDQQPAERRHAAPSQAPPVVIFRREATEHHAASLTSDQLLRLGPGWTRWTFWLMALAAVAGLAFASVVRVKEYASGPAIVRVEGRLELTAPFAATVANVLVQPGERVRLGTPLVQFAQDDEQAEFARIDRELDLQMLKLLRDPTDNGARTALSGLYAARDLAESRLDARLFRARSAGVVSDVRVRPGERVNPGDLIASIVGPNATHSLIAVLPGQYRPVLKPGMTLRFELDGYRATYRDVTIDRVGDEVVGPAESKRYLGAGAADTLIADGPLMLVHAQLGAASFRSDNRRLSYFDGLHGRAEVAVRSEPLLLSLVPGLKGLYRRE